MIGGEKKMKLDIYKTALTVGFFFSGVHIIWSLLVLLGWAQALLNFIFWAHMIENPYTVTGFDFTRALTLIIVTFIVGAGVGKIFALIWNKVHKK